MENSTHENCSSCFISTNPSSSSRHFENTLKVIDKKRNNNIKRASSLSSILEEPPSSLDIELEVIDRLKELKLNESDGALNSDFKSLLEKKLPANNNEQNNEAIYFLSKDRSGATTLRMKFVNSLNNLSSSIRNGINVLSGKRVSEMTTCYEDIEAVTRLLQEKEKDLELTIHIGKDLLAQNIQHEKRILELETELKNANESIAQLNHELFQKTELINILTDNEEALSENANSPTTTKTMSFDFLQRKISVLETENRKLYSDVEQVVKETDEIEEKERRLMADLSEQLNSTHMEYESINLELERYKEENRLQNEQINHLTNRLSDAEMRLHELLSENEECYITLSVTKENQNMLANELVELKSRYQETSTLLQETQALLREKQRKSQPQSNRSSLFVPSGLSIPTHHYNPESLQSELMESSLFSENSSLDSGINSDSGDNKKGIPQFQKVFNTVKCASSASMKNDGSLASELNLLTSSQPRMSSSIYSSDSMNKTSSDKLASFSMYSSIYGASKTDDVTSTESSEDYNSHLRYGLMGCPGAKDLESALKNLSSAEILSRRAKLSFDSGSESCGYEHEAHTPESMFSSNSASTGSSSLSGYRYPKKLEIVKPLEGSVTLNIWQNLATPAFGSCILQDNERVKVRGEKGLEEFGLQTYSLGDVEEDVEEFPGKNYISSSCIYTYTDSTILHPDDGASITFSLPPSQMSSRMQSTCTSRQPTAPPTPRLGLSRRNSCSTFSISTGLASMLNERGIQAITPSCLNTPTTQNFSPTVTPCNSPEGGSSPAHSSNRHEPVTLTSFLTSSAGLLKKKITGHHYHQQQQHNNSSNNSHSESEKAAIILEKKAKFRSIKLLEKVETLGIENILPSSSSSSSASSSTHHIINKPLALHSSNIYTRYHSPMTQLTSLKHLSSKSCHEYEADKSSSESSSAVAAALRSTSPTNSQQKESPEARAKQKLNRQKTRRSMNAQRQDLGTVNSAVDKSKEPKQGLIGSISSIFFGRKGGFL